MAQPIRTALAYVVACVLAMGLCLVIAGCSGDDDNKSATVMGYVHDDSTLAPIQGATAKIAGRTSAPTDANGMFTISEVGPGTRTMTIHKSGYATRDFEVELQRGSNNVGVKYLPEVHTPGMGRVTGTVRDTTGVVKDALVVVGGRTAMSKADGSFAIYNVAPGDTVVTAQSGARIGRVVVTVVPDTTTVVDVTLTVSPPLPPVI